MLFGVSHDYIRHAPVIDLEERRYHCLTRWSFDAGADVAKSIGVSAGFNCWFECDDLICEKVPPARWVDFQAEKHGGSGRAGVAEFKTRPDPHSALRPISPRTNSGDAIGFRSAAVTL